MCIFSLYFGCLAQLMFSIWTCIELFQVYLESAIQMCLSWVTLRHSLPASHTSGFIRPLINQVLHSESWSPSKHWITPFILWHINTCIHSTAHLSLACLAKGRNGSTLHKLSRWHAKLTLCMLHLAATMLNLAVLVLVIENGQRQLLSLLWSQLWTVRVERQEFLKKDISNSWQVRIWRQNG